jgi:hypothetical protein
VRVVGELVDPEDEEDRSGDDADRKGGKGGPWAAPGAEEKLDQSSSSLSEAELMQ